MANRISLLVALEGADEGLKRAISSAERSFNEAARLDRSLSWIVQQCWKISRSKLKEFPSSTEEPGSLPDPREE